MPIYEVTKNFKEIVEAEDEQDAYGVFDHHSREFYSQESDAEEIKSLPHADRLGYDLETIPWGGADNVTIREIFEAKEKEDWEKRVPVYVVDEDHVSDDLRIHAPGFKKAVEIEDALVGYVVYSLPDDSLVLEKPGDVEKRRASGVTDNDVRRQIAKRKLAHLRELVRQQEEAVDELT